MILSLQTWPQTPTEHLSATQGISVSITSPNIPTAAFNQVLELTSPLCSQSQQHGPVTRLRVSRPDAQLLQRGRRGRRRGQSLFPRVILSSALGRRERYTGNKLPLLSILSHLNFPHHLFPPLSQFGTNARSLWLRGDGLLYFCGAFRLASRGSGRRGERIREG